MGQSDRQATDRNTDRGPQTTRRLVCLPPHHHPPSLVVLVWAGLGWHWLVFGSGPPANWFADSPAKPSVFQVSLPHHPLLSPRFATLIPPSHSTSRTVSSHSPIPIHRLSPTFLHQHLQLPSPPIKPTAKFFSRPSPLWVLIDSEFVLRRLATTFLSRCTGIAECSIFLPTDHSVPPDDHAETKSSNLTGPDRASTTTFQVSGLASLSQVRRRLFRGLWIPSTRQARQVRHIILD
jgi:hypothetical protein